MVHLQGDSYGLVPSDGTVYVFGAGQAVRHRTECWYGSDTPDHEVMRVPDPQRDLWRRLSAIPFSARARREALARDVGLFNARGGPAWTPASTARCGRARPDAAVPGRRRKV